MGDAARVVSFSGGQFAAIPVYLEARRDLGRACGFAGKLPPASQPLQVVAMRHRDDDQAHAQSAAVDRAIADPRRAAAELRLPGQTQVEEPEVLWPVEVPIDTPAFGPIVFSASAGATGRYRALPRSKLEVAPRAQDTDGRL